MIKKLYCATISATSSTSSTSSIGGVQVWDGSSPRLLSYVVSYTIYIVAETHIGRCSCALQSVCNEFLLCHLPAVHERFVLLPLLQGSSYSSNLFTLFTLFTFRVANTSSSSALSRFAHSVAPSLRQENILRSITICNKKSKIKHFPIEFL